MGNSALLVCKLGEIYISHEQSIVQLTTFQDGAEKI